MAKKTDFALFLDELHDEVRSHAQEESKQKPNLKGSFTELVAEELAEYGDVENMYPCEINEKTGNGNLALNGYFINGDRDRLDLFVSIYSESSEGETTSKTAIVQGFERARRILQLVDKGWVSKKYTVESEQGATIAAIRDAASTIRDVQVFVLSDSAVRDTTEIKETIGKRNFRCLIWDIERLHRVRQSGKAYEAIEINVSEYTATPIQVLPMPGDTNGYKTYLTFLPGEFLCRLYDEYGPRLLQLNVRSFLQARGKVNKGIRNTIINEPELFLAYNNGLTATVETIECETTKEGKIVVKKLVGFQVVNGGQTVASIHQTAKKDKAPLDQVLVQAKISYVSEELLEQLVPKISRFANTQNRVNEADFSANDPLHITIEELAERVWCPGETSRWFYERARGQYQVAKARIGTTPAKQKKFTEQMPTSQKFSKTDLAKYLNSWGQKPDIVSRGAQKNFTNLMDSLTNSKEPEAKDETWFKRLIAKAIIFKKAESIARKLKLPAYRANAITYTVASISYRTRQRIDLDSVWERQAVSDVLERTITNWMLKVHAALIDSAKGRNVTEWCKKQDCWRHIQTMALGVPEDLEQELAKGQVLPNVGKDGKVENLELTPEDRDNLATVMMVPDTVWLDIHKWGTTDNNLVFLENGIAHTLISYAASNWVKVPSRKQAKHGASIIEKARPHIDSLAAVFGDIRELSS